MKFGWVFADNAWARQFEKLLTFPLASSLGINPACLPIPVGYPVSFLGRLRTLLSFHNLSQIFFLSLLQTCLYSTASGPLPSQLLNSAVFPSIEALLLNSEGPKRSFLVCESGIYHIFARQFSNIFLNTPQ